VDYERDCYSKYNEAKDCPDKSAGTSTCIEVETELTPRIGSATEASEM